MHLDKALKIAEDYLEPTGEYEVPSFQQRMALRRVTRAVKTLRGALDDVRNNIDDALEAAMEDK